MSASGGGPRIVVTGSGLLSALGDSPAALHAALCAGRSGLVPVTVVSTEGLGERLAGEIGDFDAARYLGDGNLRPLDRTSRLATAAAALALENAGLGAAARGALALGDTAGLALGTMFGSVRTIAEFDRRALTAGPNYVSPLDFANSVINAAAGHAAIWHGLRGINATLAGGSSAGGQAIGYACDQLRAGRASVLLAGGAEEMSFEALLGMSRWRTLSNRPRPFAADRDGFAFGEGAALLVLERAEDATRRGAKAQAEVLGHGVAFGPAGSELGLATALANALRLALEASGVGADDVDLISTGGSGDVLLDAAEARALAQVFGEREVPAFAIKGLVGDALGAGAALQAVALLGAMAAGFVPGTPSADGAALVPGLASVGRVLRARRGAVTALDADGQAVAIVFGEASE